MLARRLLRGTSQPMILPGPIVATVGMSIGMAILEVDEDPTEVLTLADKNMYLMKSRHSTQASRIPRPVGLPAHPGLGRQPPVVLNLL